MAGLKLGSNVLQVGGSDQRLIAALAKVVGLSGRACAVAPSPEETSTLEQAAEKAGVLVEVREAPVTALPHDDDFFDLVVLKNLLGGLSQNDRVACVQQAYRVLRAGGRCLVIDSAMRGGLGAIISRQLADPRYLESGGGKASLEAEGFLGVRLLAERDGLVFVEGSKPTGQPD